MTSKHKIKIEPEETLGAPGTPAQEERDKEIAQTGTVPDEVLTESPDEADIVAESGAEEILPEDVKDLLERCRAAEKKAEEEHDSFIRTFADFNNYRRRTREEMEGMRKFAIEDFALKLLPVMDNFERAIKSAEESKDFDALHSGVLLIMRQLKEALEKEGVKEIEAEGAQFDPTKHEAVMRYETEECPENIVVEEMLKGYMLDKKVIRPSMVKVSCKP
ncbi:MAG: nucleotide exchange factor GrpE [Armatimonadota bacterium]|jgi:molecular chaperone GrpE